MKKGKFKRFKEQKEKKGNNSEKLMILFIVFIMVVSGFFYFAREEPISPEEQPPEIPIDRYNTSRIGNSSLLIVINNITNDFVVFPKSSVPLT